MNELLNRLLSELADEIDITESQEGAISRAYNSVADWLNQKDTSIVKHEVQIFPQGSMMYGTAIKPIDEDDYDIDLVCEFTKLTNGLDPEYVKKSVGKRLSENDNYRKMMQEEGRRCWTLKYSDSLNFHMDILPAIPYSATYAQRRELQEAYNSMADYKDRAMLATDKNKKTFEYKYIPTNPRGYAEWFKQRMQIGRPTLIKDSIERVPKYSGKTVLQKAIQLLKRHRDVMFADDIEELKPISMIITTLIAKCYTGERSIFEFICNALGSLDKYIEKGASGEYIIKNPVMSSENFADKWKEKPQKATAFFNWKKKAIKDFARLGSAKSYYEFEKLFKELFSQKPVDRLMLKYRNELQREREIAATTTDLIPREVAALEKLPHRVRPPWSLPKGYNVKIKGEVSYNNRLTYKQIVSGTTLPKGVDLLFTPIHQIKPPYRVKWQITNTGEEARRAGCLRGKDFESGDVLFNGILNSKKETTSYTGTHYVQCFIIKNENQCVGQSTPFVVSIK